MQRTIFELDKNACEHICVLLFLFTRCLLICLSMLASLDQGIIYNTFSRIRYAPHLRALMCHQMCTSSHMANVSIRSQVFELSICALRIQSVHYVCEWRASRYVRHTEMEQGYHLCVKSGAYIWNLSKNISTPSFQCWIWYIFSDVIQKWGSTASVCSVLGLFWVRKITSR